MFHHQGKKAKHIYWYFILKLFLEGYKARVRKMRPGEDFEDIMHDFRMEEERRRMKMFPEFRSRSKPSKTYDPPPRFEKAKTG